MTSLRNDLIVIMTELLFSSFKNILFLALLAEAILAGTGLPVDLLLMLMHFLLHFTCSQCDTKQYWVPLRFLVLTSVDIIVSDDLDPDCDSSVLLLFL